MKSPEEITSHPIFTRGNRTLEHNGASVVPGPNCTGGRTTLLKVYFVPSPGLQEQKDFSFDVRWCVLGHAYL